MTRNPATAPARPDLTFLRHRSRPVAAGADAGANPVADFLSGRGPRRNRPAPSEPAAAPGGGGPISFDRPGRTQTPAASGSLDLSAPAPPPSAPASPAGTPISFDRPGRTQTPAASGSLDLSAPAPPPSAPAPPRAAPPPAAGSLDLSTPASPPISYQRPGRSTAPPPSSPLDLSSTSSPGRPPAVAPAVRAAPGRRLRGARVRPGREHLLSVREPTVVLTRLQSGIGELTIEAVCSPEVGDLRLGAAYQLRSGSSSTVQLAGGARFAPSARRPVLVASRDEFDRLGVDLRQVRDLERMAVYAFSESRAELTWSGTLVVSTSGGAQIELPLESLYAGRIAVLMTIYNLAGELVIRAEMETIIGDVREAARAYGYDRITWRDDRTPVD